MTSTYIGRFAPSPSGPLHLGSLACALLSFIHAKQHQGRWLVRIEDIDPPREQAGASDAIVDSLAAHGLISDHAICYQSDRSAAYQEALSRLRDSGMSYRCQCTRKRLNTLLAAYDNRCRNASIPVDTPTSVRLNLAKAAQSHGLPLRGEWIDELQGHQRYNLEADGDFIIHRKDGLFAYQLAVVVDDIQQRITHVVRGVDLLDATPGQRFLQQCLGGHTTSYCHIPVLINSDGQKLSKQHHAPAIDNSKALHNLLLVLGHYGVTFSESPSSIPSLLDHAIAHFDFTKLRSLREIPTDPLPHYTPT